MINANEFTAVDLKSRIGEANALIYQALKTSTLDNAHAKVSALQVNARADHDTSYELVCLLAKLELQERIFRRDDPEMHQPTFINGDLPPV